MAKFNTIVVKSQKFVLVPYAEFKLMEKGVPPMPAPNADGNYPARETLNAMIARGIVKDRESVGLTQTELATAAGIRVEVLNRAERGAVVPSVKTLTKIENALVRAGMKRARPGSNPLRYTAQIGEGPQARRARKSAR